MATGNKTTERRHKLRIELINAGEAILSEQGLSALTARAAASAVGCSVGAIYNVFEDIDGLIIAVNSRTLAKLDQKISRFVPGDASGLEPEDCLSGLAVAYCQFAIEHTNAWSALFEHGERISRSIPDWHMDEHVHLIGHIVKSLRQLQPGISDEDGRQLAGLLFSAVHGVVSLGLQGFFFAVPQRELETQVSLLVRATLAGLKKSA
ncbi:TetR/AcrR family transcriptional regulator [Anderseniella sp. Alg231-50]|uniref:TetR/AcrR family transcriptional regulator n=1 Tax=Anderseniella sp. Alg231-50 TaxID=1922226 RepID=UPI00307BF782